jgi:hypothetical protein
MLMNASLSHWLYLHKYIVLYLNRNFNERQLQKRSRNTAAQPV